MKWTESIVSYPIILTHYKKKIAAKRRMKASQGLDETLTTQDMEQIGNDIIKTMKENLPDDIEKPNTYNDVIVGLKEGKIAEKLGFRVEDFNAKPAPVENPPYQETVTEEAVTEQMNPDAPTPEEIAQAESMATEQPVEEVVVEETLPVEEPVVVEETVIEETVVPAEVPVEVDVNEGVGDVGKRLADEMKPLVPFFTPVPAPLPYQTKYGQTNRPLISPNKTSNNPQLGTSKLWNDDLKFW
jgi:hypothetical protein